MSYTKSEQKWIDDLNKLARRTPKNIRLYVTDSALIVCKNGVPSFDSSQNINARLNLDAGCSLSAMHDDLNNEGKL